MNYRLGLIVMLGLVPVIWPAARVAAQAQRPAPGSVDPFPKRTPGVAERGRPRNEANPGQAGFDDSFYKKKLTEAQKKLLRPAAEVEAAHREFLRQEHTGLFRLLPRGKYEFTATVAASAVDRALPIRGGGAFYSFAEKKHALGPWSEVSLYEGRLTVGFVHQALGVMTMLGDVPLDRVTPATPGVDYLARLVPPTELAAARAQDLRNDRGFKDDVRFYSATLPAVVNQTYALRSTVYKKQGRMRVGSGFAYYVPHPYEYGGVDELIAFRILRVDADGSVTILWKRLQKFSPPRIKQQ